MLVHLKILIKMDWTSLYFKTSNLNVFILGTGEAAVNETEENPYVHEMYALTAGHQQHQ